MPPRNVDQLARVYGPATWDVYAHLDESLNPRGADWLHELAAPASPIGSDCISA